MEQENLFVICESRAQGLTDRSRLIGTATGWGGNAEKDAM
jgi:hypothetical protein